MAESRRGLGGAERALFMLALVPYLLDRGEVSLDEISEHFDVSRDLVLRTVELLPVTGIPGDANAYLDNDLFEIDYEALDEGLVVLTRNIVIDETPRFSAREAAALIAGLQYLSALPENADSSSLTALAAKLARGTTDRPGEVGVAPRAPDAALGVIRAAVAAGTRITFDYLNARGVAESRLVDPLRLESNDEDWYLRAWCSTREGVRTFRLDRMGDVRATRAPIEHRLADVTLPDTLFQASPDDLEVVIELPETAMTLLTDYNPHSTTPASTPGRVMTTVRLAHLHGLKRLVAGLGGLATVLEPADARRAVADWAAAGVAQYAED